MNICTVVIVTFNSAYWIESSLNSVAGCDTLVLDNASTDLTAQRIIENYPNVKMIRNETNLGYGRAANKAFQLIDSPYALLLNPDVSIEKSQLDALLAMPEKLGEDWLYVAPNTGHAVTKLASPDFEPLQRITHATGCALLFNLEKFRELGGFDERIFLYYEEMDLSVRAHNRGLKMYYAAEIMFPHHSKQSVAHSDELELLRSWHFQWSSLYYKKKHRLWRSFYEGILTNVFVAPVRALFGTAEKKQRYRIKAGATLDFLKGKKAFVENGKPFAPKDKSINN